MSRVVNTEARIRDVKVTADTITARLVDGRVISVPLAWSWRLSEATPAQRENFEIIGDGEGVHWPEVDEDISVQGMLHGVPARRRRPGRDQSRNERAEAARHNRQQRSSARRAGS